MGKPRRNQHSCAVLVVITPNILRDHVLELAVVERGIEPAAREQFAVRALLDDVAVAHDEDTVGIADGAQAVRDDKARAAAHEVIHRLLDELLGAGVDRAGRLIENENGGVCGT